MPEFDLTRESLTPQRWAHTVGYIEAVMVYPDGGDDQSTALDLAEVEIGQEAATSGDLDPDGMFFLLEAAKALPSKSDIQARASLDFFRGVIAGFVLANALEIAAAGKSGTVRAAKTRAIGAFSSFAMKKGLPTGRDGNLTETFVKESWDRYRCVSHLYASFWLFAQKRAVLYVDGHALTWRLPCPRGGIIPFLQVAEAYRKRGERQGLPQAKGTLLDAAETWRVPEALGFHELGSPVIDLSAGGKDATLVFQTSFKELVGVRQPTF